MKLVKRNLWCIIALPCRARHGKTALRQGGARTELPNLLPLPSYAPPSRP